VGSILQFKKDNEASPSPGGLVSDASSKNHNERDSKPHVYGYWLEEIGIQTKDSIELVKKEKSFFGFRSVDNRFSHESPILLLNKAIVVFFGRSRTDEGGFIGLTILEVLVIDEFSSLIGTNS
jgi:hypothetical protein